MRLIKLTLENFKGVLSFTFTPDGQSVTVRGTNGAGKSTLYDAYCWLLFGKDSENRADFDILPYSNPDALVSVSAEFDLGANGGIELCRTFTRKIVRQKGTDEPSIKNEYKFFVNGVPKNKTAYSAAVEEICTAEKLLMLSDPDYFAGKLDWKKRRKTLGELFGDVTDADLLTDSKWDALRTELNGRTVEDFRAVATAERKKVKQELDVLPDRINEAERAIPQETATTSDLLNLAALGIEIDGLKSKRADIVNGLQSAKINQDIADLKAEIASKKTAYLADIGNYNEMILCRLDGLNSEYTNVQNGIDSAISQITSDEEKIKVLESDLDELRDNYRQLHAMSWDSTQEICPTCGQPLSADRIEELKAKFNINKAAAIEWNVSDGKSKNAEIARLRENVEIESHHLAVNKTKLQALCEQIEEAEKAIVKHTPYEYTDEYKTFCAKLQELIKQKEALQFDRAYEVADIDAKIEQLEKEQRELQALQAAVNVAEQQRKRIEELKERGRELGKRAAQLDNLLDLAARFEQYRLTAIEKNVNDRFQYAKFKLFDQQINGGYAECCEVVVDDAPYSTNLNPGKKINAGLDIIRTLSEAYGFTAPVWVDNAESYVKLMDIGAQVITLRVDESAESLTVEEVTE